MSTKPPKPLPELTGSLRALADLQKGTARHTQPLAIIGPREATAEQLACAERLAARFAAAGMVILCGGRNGVTEAASRGVHSVGGTVIGMLPEEDTSRANPYLTVALPTGMGIMRNALIARSAVAAVAVGGGLGTISEMALALQWGKPVFTICNAPAIDGARVFADEEALAEAVAGHLLELAALAAAKKN